jgi:hypothetical protein
LISFIAGPSDIMIPYLYHLSRPPQDIEAGAAMEDGLTGNVPRRSCGT